MVQRTEVNDLNSGRRSWEVQYISNSSFGGEGYYNHRIMELQTDRGKRFKLHGQKQQI